MCKSFETGVCKFGTGCNFAHGLADLRSPARGGAGVGGPPQPPQRPMNGGPLAGGIGSTLQNGKFKTVMCEKIASQVTEFNSLTICPISTISRSICSVHGIVILDIVLQGHCPRGYMCGFSHSQAELVTARERDPTYKTRLCTAWKESGECSKGSMCIFAHGVADIRTKVRIHIQK